MAIISSLLLKNWKIFAIGAIALAAIFFVKHTIDENRDLKDTVNKLDVAFKQQKETIDYQSSVIEDWERSRTDFIQQLEDLQRSSIEAKRERERLIDIFREHDFEALLNAKPETMERLVNSGSNRAFRLLQCATGSEDCTDSGEDTN
jgi:hypothetical protein